MISIYSCKMFRSSSRKDSIVSAIENPINSELVQQLKEYIDIPDARKDVAEDEPVSEQRKLASRNNPESESLPAGLEKDSPVHKTPGLVVDIIEDVPSPDTEVVEDTEKVEVPPEDVVDEYDDKVEIEESTKITASTSIPEQLKGTLNIDESTAGVNRVVVKDKELWVYYKDSVNLNNVMTEVLDRVNAANFSTLSFSRLARSDNAIVFDILENSHPVEVIDNGDAKEA